MNSAGSINVLLVENDRIDQTAFVRMVQKRRLAYACTIAISICDALAQLRHAAFDVIVSDYMLEDGTVFDLTHVLPEIPIILITGSGNGDVHDRALRAGVSAVLIKDTGGAYLDALPDAIARAVAG